MNKKTINVNVDLDDKQAKKKLEELEKRKYKVNLDVDDSGVKNTTQSVRNLSKTTDETNNIFGKLKNTISQTFSAGKLQMAAYLTVIKEINDAGERAKQTIEDIDKAVTDLQIATDMSRESVQGLVKGYNDYGKQLGATTTQITAAADDYLRAGKTLNESQALIKDSIMLSKLGQIDSGEATSDLLAVMNGYKMSVDEVGKALDSMVALDMKAATSSGDIATAMKYSASSAEVAGLSFNKLAAMIAVVQDRTQQSAETIGTFYNTLLSRYRDIKIGKFITDEGENISDFESVLKSVGISLCDSSGEFRAFETIIEEVAGKWNMLSSVQRAALAKAQSGTRQQNRYYALMEGYADVLKLTEVAAQSAGTAIDKYNESYMNSLDAKKASLQASFESMIINANLDTVYADIIDCTKSLVDFINKTNALKGVFTGIAVGTGIKAFLSLKTGINEAYISLNKFHNALSMVKQGNIDTSSFQRLLLLSNGLSASQTKLLLSTKNLSTTQKEQILVNQGLSKEEAKLQLQAWGLTTANTGLTAATTSLGNAFKGLFATLMANPIIIVTAAVSGAVMAWQSYNQKIEETRRKNIEMAESASEQAGELTKLYVKYETLNKIQDRTASQEEQLKIVVNEITGALGDKASALEGLTEGTKEYTEVLKNATKEELENYYATAKIGAKAAEDELKGKAWDGFWGSKVTIRQNENMTGNKKHMAALNEVKDILSAYEDVGSQGLEWEPINWDKDRDNMDAVVDYYNALIEARNKLATSPNADSLMDTNIYKSINTTINDLTDSVEKYTKQKYESLKLEYMYNEGIPATEEEFKKMEQSILDASGAGEEFKNILKNYLAEDFSLLSGEIDGITESVENLQETAEQVSKVTLSTTDALASIQSLSKGLDQLDKIYADVLNKEDFDWSSILNNQGFIEAFGNMENVTDDYKNAYDDFIRVISNSPTNINACQNAFNNLATAYIYNSGALQNVTAETKQATIAMLEQMGVSNATAIVTAQLAANEIAAQVATNGLSNATYGAITALTNEGNACSETVNALFDLITKTEIFANTSLNTESKIRELENLATAFGLTAATAGDWSNSKEWAYAKAHGVTEETYLGILQDRYKEQIQKQFKPVKVNYTGGTTTKNTQASLNKGSGNKGSTTKQKDTKQIIDWIDQKLKVLGKRLDVIKTKAAEVYSTFKNQNKELDKAISNLERQIEVQKSAKKKYLDKANKVGLSKDLKTKVQNGNMSIKDYDSKTAEKIKEYQEWYEKAKDVDEIIQQLKLDIQELAKQKLENIVDDFDRKNSYQQALMNLREAKMGDNPKESDYNYLIKKQNHIKYNAQKEYNLLKKQFDELVNEGKIKKGSDAWYEWMEKLVDVELSIEDCDIALEEFQKTVRELRWKKFNEAIEKLERINDTINDTKSLLSGDLFDDGKLTQTGKATILLNFQGMANAKQEIEEHKNAIKALGEELANKTITQEEYDKAVAEHIKLQNQAALSMKQYYDDIINIGVQAIDEETEAFRKKQKKSVKIFKPKEIYTIIVKVSKKKRTILLFLERKLHNYQSPQIVKTLL